MDLKHTADYIASFATYVPLEGPVAVLLKVIGPKTLISFCCVCWGLSTLGMGKPKMPCMLAWHPIDTNQALYTTGKACTPAAW